MGKKQLGFELWPDENQKEEYYGRETDENESGGSLRDASGG